MERRKRDVRNDRRDLGFSCFPGRSWIGQRSFSALPILLTQEDQKYGKSIAS